MPISALLLAAAIVTPAPAPAADPLAPARKGLVECVDPNESAHICRALTHYVEGKDGTWQATTNRVLLPGRPLTMETAYAVKVEGNAVCSTFDKATLDKAVLRVNGQPLPEDRAAMVRERLDMVLGPMLGKKLCATTEAADKGLVKKGTIDGQPSPRDGGKVAWVAADAGYKVEPDDGTPSL